MAVTQSGVTVTSRHRTNRARIIRDVASPGPRRVSSSGNLEIETGAWISRTRLPRPGRGFLAPSCPEFSFEGCLWIFRIPALERDTPLNMSAFVELRLLHVQKQLQMSQDHIIDLSAIS
jgi:hypothetical protein